MQKVSLIAGEKGVRYGRVKYRNGEPFSATLKEASLLIALGLAEKKPDRQSVPVILTRARPAEEAMVAEPEMTALEKEPVAGSVETKSHQRDRHGNYRRRDLRPENRT